MDKKVFFPSSDIRYKNDGEKILDAAEEVGVKQGAHRVLLNQKCTDNQQF